MKKWWMFALILSLAVFAAACGSEDKEKADDAKQEVSKKAEKKTTKEESQVDSATSEDSTASSTQQDSTKDTADSNAQPSGDSSASSDEKTNSDTNQDGTATSGTFSLSTTGFQVSNVLPVTGGTVKTTYLSSSPSFVKDFDNLVITVNQYKVESVQGATKQIDAADPTSFLQNQDGYVVTLDVSIKNKTGQDITYKPDMINLVGASELTGGSLDNFVPSSYHLIGSEADPYVFTAGKTARGLLTFMMNNSKFEDLAKNSRIAVPSPSKIDANLKNQGDPNDVVASFPVR
ncbi:DUF5068 domain-containing protein [Listeria costaricensis]|uniref:DUF5068 domain-containing protein n=1 Tax=Listeria costaricensis TaxID=2026604 RepID=UPI000C078D52|nr:DUF5068 domain-containing protein [Listeria costaricensis]